MPGQLDVVNQALLELGKNPVTAYTDTPAATTIWFKLAVLYPLLLEDTDWNFSIVFRQDSTPLSVSPTPDFAFAYVLPSDYARMDRFSWLTQNFGLYYRIIDGLILTNANPILYYYVSNQQNYANMPSHFYRALSLFAAWDSCMSITQNEALAKYIKGKFEEARSNAKLINDMDRYVQQRPYDDFDRSTYI